ncbi:unnamed protein product, partial [Oppiella nova]
YRAYHLFRSYGIPEENIIIFHYDDIAYNKQNPTPGIVINEYNGTDVYKGVPKDYTGKDVNPSNLLAVLQGDQELAKRGKKVVNSGPNDHIFAYFGDHGFPGGVSFATGSLYATELNAALKRMHQDNKFAKLVFYIDTCESGSMFYKLLPDNINVYAVTSSTPTEPSYFWKYDKTLKTMIGSWFADHWLIDDETNDLEHETFDEQFKYFADLWNVTDPDAPGEQYAQRYGNMTFGKLHISEFLGHKPHNSVLIDQARDSEQHYSAVNKWDVSLYLLHRRIDETNDVLEKQKYTEELEGLLNARHYADKHMTEYVNSIQHLIPNIATNAILHTKQELNNHECYQKLVNTFNEHCFNLSQNTYLLRKMQIFVNICEEMRDSTSAIPLSAQLTQANNVTKWVLLCAGSNGWENYADQALVYRAYHMFRSYGIPEDHIIIFHYDDIAYNSENPTPGIVINEIGGPDVYKGVPKDYTGKDVTPKNFLGALTGDQQLADQGKKVIKSGPNDHIFAYFGDHGSNDLVSFATGILYAKDLNNALIDMHSKQKFAKLVFYIDTCHSGSMFYKHLPDNINVYAATSSLPTEDSWFWNYDKTRGTYLSAFFANNWLENDQNFDLTKETFQEQYKYFADRYNVSGATQHAQHYGDMSLGNLYVSEFLGHKPSKQLQQTVDKYAQNYDAISKWDVSLDLLQRRIKFTNDLHLKIKYTEELEHFLKARQYADNHMTEYVKSIQHLMPNIATNAILHTKQELNNHECYRKLVDTFNENCFNLAQNTYLLRKMQIFVNICEQMRDSSDADIAVNRLIQHCESNANQEFHKIL